MASWTASDIPDLTGRVAVVTGANSGLGLETAKALALRGATILMACRHEGRGRAAAEHLDRMVPPGRIERLPLDLSDFDSIRAFAHEFGARHGALDILVNNAGVMAPPARLTTRQGFELQFGTNHLGHFALTGLLLPSLMRAPGSRVVTVSSIAHETGRIEFDDLQLERNYTPYGAYGQSKLANVMFMRELNRRLEGAGIASPLSIGAHPGFASTNLQAAGPFIGTKPISSWLTLAAVRLIGQSARRGAEPQLYAAVAPGVAGGDYYGPKNRIRGPVVVSDMARQARDEETASRLWDVSKRLTGVDIDEAIASGGAAIDV